MHTLLHPKRPLLSLTQDECQTLFALAFGYAPPIHRLHAFGLIGPITIGFETRSIILYPDGQILAEDVDGEKALIFNARKVIGQLDAYNISFGEPLTDPQL